RGQPEWLNENAEFRRGDLRDRDTITAALDQIDIVFHQAAYGGYMPELAKFVHVNSLGTAQMLEVMLEKNLPIKKIVVASSQAVYSEGAGICPKHQLVFPDVRPVEQLRKGDWQVHCPICGAITKSAPTPENAPVGGETVYGLTKVDQEKLVLLWGKQVGSQRPHCAIRALTDRANPSSIPIPASSRFSAPACSTICRRCFTKMASRCATSRSSKTSRARTCSRLRPITWTDWQ